ncbi:MAG: phosphate ABC transporter permease subunit PstC [Porphyromonadaceae bacterium]|nr:phosphate ABC transporter permease subunit PstC [Porphyromonadaceae bacterium]
MKRLIERVAEGGLALSGTVTSLVILLISIFIFSEGMGLFSSPVVEESYGLYVHSSNPVRTLTIEQTKQIFDGELTNWREINGLDSEISILRIDDIAEQHSQEELGENYEHLPRLIAEAIDGNPNVLAFLPEEYVQDSERIKPLNMGTISLRDFFAGQSWMPTAAPAPLYGVLPLILGTLLVSLVAMIIALPVGLGVAIYLSEIASPLVRQILRPALELLAGIPSVVYGFWGLVVLVPWIQRTWELPVGETALAGSILLAIMALPTMISVAQDAILNTPRAMREASLALGASHWQTIRHVVLPYARSGIMAAVILGMGRAIGETMAVLMVTGNAAIMPSGLLDSVRTIPATIAAELGEVPVGSTHYQALFILGGILFVITMIMSISAEYISRKQIKQHL